MLVLRYLFIFKATLAFLFLTGLIHMEIMTFDPDNPRVTAT